MTNNKLTTEQTSTVLAILLGVVTVLTYIVKGGEDWDRLGPGVERPGPASFYTLFAPVFDKPKKVVYFCSTIITHCHVHQPIQPSFLPMERDTGRGHPMVWPDSEKGIGASYAWGLARWKIVASRSLTYWKKHYICTVLRYKKRSEKGKSQWFLRSKQVIVNDLQILLSETIFH